MTKLLLNMNYDGGEYDDPTYKKVFLLLNELCLHILLNELCLHINHRISLGWKFYATPHLTEFLGRKEKPLGLFSKLTSKSIHTKINKNFLKSHTSVCAYKIMT